MRFYLGETYERRGQGQQRWALVVRLADGGATARYGSLTPKRSAPCGGRSFHKLLSGDESQRRASQTRPLLFQNCPLGVETGPVTKQAAELSPQELSAEIKFDHVISEPS